MIKINTFIIVLLLFSFYGNSQNLTDYDGNTYKTFKIGSQEWLSENLRVTHYNNGDSIPNHADSLWNRLRKGALCDYNNEVKNAQIYGHMYNWYAVTDSRNICPVGWHVPSDREFYELILALDSSAKNIRGVESRIILNDKSVFNGKLGGARSGTNSSFFKIGKSTSFWTTSEYDKENTYTGEFPWAWTHYVNFNDSVIKRVFEFKTDGAYVRCKKDQ